jgi:FkbM family methyltransferase
MSRLLNLFRPGPIDTTYQGASFRFHYLASGTESGAMLNPAYNQEELDFLRGYVPSEGTFVDIGANVGTYAMVLARRTGPGGHVIAIEPHPVAFARLSFNNQASNYKHVQLVQAAASDIDGELLLETDGDNLGASHVTLESAEGAIKVHSWRLLTIIEQAGIDHIDALKIDVEGYEDRVLIGFFRDAPKALWPRAVVIEHLSHDEWQQDCLKDMIDRGYAVIGRTRSNTLLAHIPLGI